MLAKQRLDHDQDINDPRQKRITGFRVFDGELNHVREAPCPVVAEQRQPSTECAGDACRDRAGARHIGKSHLVDALNVGGDRGRALAADDLDLSARDIP